jgi:hypothetical protein
MKEGRWITNTRPWGGQAPATNGGADVGHQIYLCQKEKFQ